MQSDTNTQETYAKKPNSQIALIALALFFSCLVSFIFLFDPASFKLLLTSFDLQLNGITTTGIVSEAKAIPDGNPVYGAFKYQLTVEFDVNGAAYNTVSEQYYSPLDHDWVGEPVEVIYDPDDPNKAIINNFNERWMGPFVEALP